MYDIIIRNGTIIDGTGEERFSADIAIKDEKFLKLEKFLILVLEKLMLKVS